MNDFILATALSIILAVYKWNQFAIISDDFILNTYLNSAIQFYVENGLLGEFCRRLTHDKVDEPGM